MNNTSFERTRKFELTNEKVKQVEYVLNTAYQALKEKGYNPINQITGYLLSGDPTYITNHNEARNLIRRVEREDLMEVLLRSYFGNIF